jgi:hypothetical protein
MELTQEQKALNNANSNKKSTENSVQEVENLTGKNIDVELNDEQLEAAAGGTGGIYIIDGDGGCTGGGGIGGPKGGYL